MPNNQGRLTKSEREQILAWLRRTVPILSCPVCQHVQWTVGEHLVVPVNLGANGLVLGNCKMYPQVMFICLDCAHTLFFNASSMGIGLEVGADANLVLDAGAESNRGGQDVNR